MCSTNNATGASARISCSQCSLGKYSIHPALPCQNCPRGFYTNNVGLTSCLRCLPGYYNNEEIKSKCKSCPDGTFNDQYASIDSVACLKCHAGKFSTLRNSSDSCTACPFGKYNPRLGQSDSSDCMKCGKV